MPLNFDEKILGISRIIIRKLRHCKKIICKTTMSVLLCGYTRKRFIIAWSKRKTSFVKTLCFEEPLCIVWQHIKEDTIHYYEFF